MSKKVIAVFGGSFNPPINSHILLAKQIIQNCKLIEKLIFVPVSTKYQKLELENDLHRYNMLKIICENEDKLGVSDIELNQNKQLYTIQTLDLLKEKYGQEYSIWFVMGTDNLKEIETWHEPKRLLKQYKVIVLERDNDILEDIIKNSELLTQNKNSLIKIDGIDKMFLSSTMIRDKIKKGENVEQYMPKKVLEYIINNRLYK